MGTSGRTTIGVTKSRWRGIALAAWLTALSLGLSVAATEGVHAAWFGFGKSKDDAPSKPAPGPAKEPMFCPKVIIQPGTAAFVLYEKGKEGDPMAVRYQASFTQFARECVDLGAEVGARIGLAGRALLGPKGVPGQKIDVPIRFVIQDDQQKVIMSRVTKLQVVIPPDQSGITFTHVEELGSIPFPGKSFRKWDFRIGFDSKAPGGPQG
jgi:hypothetical protein